MDTKKGMEEREGFFYTEKHEWVKAAEDGTALCGITDFAQHSLGDIVFVEFPSSLLDSSIEKGEVIAVVESAKAASDVYSPVSGQVVELNSAVEDTPDTVNSSPYDEGWFIRIELSDRKELDSLMSASAYRDFLASGG